MQQRRAGTHRVCILNWVLLLVLPGIPWVAQLQPSREGACLAPSLQVGWGQGPYQREVVMAGVVAGVLAFWAEALRAQRQAGPPAPAQAKPGGGETGLLMAGDTHTQFPKGSWAPACCREGAEAPNPHPYATGAGRGRWTCSTQEVALSPSSYNVLFFGPLHPPTLQPHLEPAMLSVDFWEPMEVVEGLVGGPARGEELSMVGAVMHPEVHPAPQHW